MNKRAREQAAAMAVLESDFRVYDSHTHLTDEAFKDDYVSVLERASAAEVAHFMLPAWDCASVAAIFDFHASLPPHLQSKVCYGIGVHPHDATEFFEKDGLKLLEETLSRAGMSANSASRADIAAVAAESAGSSAAETPAGKNGTLPKIAAIGEIGLDYYYDNSPRDLQQATFKEQIKLAAAYKLPLIIHSREAHAETLSILQEAAVAGYLQENPGVIHCYSGSKEHAESLLALGFCLGFDGPITYKNARRSHEVLEICPPERILVETDAPYLTPEPWRGKRNEPLYVKSVLHKIAEIKGMELAVLAEQVYTNTVKLFGTS